MEATAWLGKVLEVLKLSTVPALAVVFVSGLLLFAPDSLIASLGMTSFVTEWRSWVGLAFLLSAALLVAHASTSVGGWVKKRWTWWTNARHLKMQFHRLAADEKEVLARFLLDRRKVLAFPINDGISQGLTEGKILYRSSSVGDALRGFDFGMQPWAWEYLNKHPHLVIHDPAKLALLAERTAIADTKGFTDGVAPWEERRPDRRWSM